MFLYRGLFSALYGGPRSVDMAWKEHRGELEFVAFIMLGLHMWGIGYPRFLARDQVDFGVVGEGRSRERVAFAGDAWAWWVPPSSSSHVCLVVVVGRVVLLAHAVLWSSFLG